MVAFVQINFVILKKIYIMTRLERDIEKLLKMIHEVSIQIILIEMDNKFNVKDSDLIKRAYKKIDSASDIIKSKKWK